MSHHELNYDKLIREQGYRVTPQRQMIMDALCAIGDHATANEVYERVQAQSPAIDRATVYRTLHLFCELRLVVATKMNGDICYEIVGQTPHHHLLCRICGREQELSNHHLDDLVEHLQREHNFTAEIDHLVIPGICGQCASIQDDV